MHLLAAAVADDRHHATFAARGIDAIAARDVVRDALVRREAAPVYRDAGPPAESETLRDFVRATRMQGGLLDMFSYADADGMIDVLLARREIAELLLTAPLRVHEAERALVIGHALARARNHGHVTFRHLARALANDPDVIEACATSAAEALLDIRCRLDEALAPATDGFVGCELDPAVRRLFWEGPAGRVDAASYARRLLATVLEEESVAELFEVPLPDLPSTIAVVRALRSSEPAAEEDDDEDAIPNDSLVDVVFHDDDTTTMDVVVVLLKDCFGLAHGAAVEAMITVHRNGYAPIATLPAHEAKHRVGIARDRARAAAMPLRISLVAASLR